MSPLDENQSCQTWTGDDLGADSTGQMMTDMRLIMGIYHVSACVSLGGSEVMSVTIRWDQMRAWPQLAQGGLRNQRVVIGVEL